MNKRGQSLSMNTIIITILVVLVLVVIAVFFAGGMSSLITKVKNIVGSSPIDISSAQLTCRGYCEKYELSNNPDFKDLFCTEKKFDIDTDGDGKISQEEKGKDCRSLGVECSSIDCSL